MHDSETMSSATLRCGRGINYRSTVVKMTHSLTTRQSTLNVPVCTSHWRNQKMYAAKTTVVYSRKSSLTSEWCQSPQTDGMYITRQYRHLHLLSSRRLCKHNHNIYFVCHLSHKENCNTRGSTMMATNHDDQRHYLVNFVHVQ